MTATATPVRVLIGKTVYLATLKPVEESTIKNVWELVAVKGSKQPKTLIESEHYFCLWSGPNGSTGRRALGLPKIVKPQFMGNLELVEA